MVRSLTVLLKRTGRPDLCKGGPISRGYSCAMTKKVYGYR